MPNRSPREAAAGGSRLAAAGGSRRLAAGAHARIGAQIPVPFILIVIVMVILIIVAIIKVTAIRRSRFWLSNSGTMNFSKSHNIPSSEEDGSLACYRSALCGAASVPAATAATA